MAIDRWSAARPAALRAMLAAALLAGCAAAPAGTLDRPESVEKIHFATSGCDGTCPAWEATFTETGGTFHGGQFAYVQGERRFVMPTALYRAIVDTLAPVRPRGARTFHAGTPGCEEAATDMRAIEVRWGTRDRLYFYTGCHGSENGRIHDVLTRAERLIPVAGFVQENAATAE